jgi:hypothetical protein
MKASEAVSNSTVGTAGSSTAEQGNSTKRQFHADSFAKVLDGRKQPIRGLWERNGRFYAQLKIENSLTGEKKTRRIPLVDKDGEAVNLGKAVTTAEYAKYAELEPETKERTFTRQGWCSRHPVSDRVHPEWREEAAHG